MKKFAVTLLLMLAILQVAFANADTVGIVSGSDADHATLVKAGAEYSSSSSDRTVASGWYKFIPVETGNH